MIHEKTAMPSRRIGGIVPPGVAALFVPETTGEGPALPLRLKQEMIARTVENCAGHVPVLAGNGDSDNFVMEKVKK